MKSPLIDVIVAVYNGEKFIEEAITSIQKQTYSHLNILIADDGSEDQTVERVREMMKDDLRIKLLTLPHRGVSATLNDAIESSSAPYIAFLDADDLWHEDKLEKQMNALDENQVAICFCMIQEFESLDLNLKQTHRSRPEPLKGYSKTTFLGKRSLFETFGLFKKEIAIGDFVEWFSRVERSNIAYKMLDEVLALRRIHENNTTKTAPKSAFLSILKTHLDEKRKEAK